VSAPSPSSAFHLSNFTREFLLASIVLMAIVAARQFSIFFPLELSADESELLVQVQRYAADGMPWRSVDGSTVGPLNPWFLMALGAVGWPLTYGGVHALAAVLQAAIVLVSYFSVRVFLAPRSAGLVATAGIVAVSGCASINFMYFATELVPALILALGFLFLLRARFGTTRRELRLIPAALCAGLAPWAKLQATPMAALLGIAALWTACETRNQAATSSGNRFRWPTLVLVAGVLPSATIVGAILVGEVFENFWGSYLVANLGYAADFAPGGIPSRLLALFRQSQLNGLLAAIAGLGLFSIFLRRKSAASPSRNPGLLVAIYLAIAIYCCVQPPHGFGHYHLFLIGPLLLALGCLLQGVDASLRRSPARDALLAGALLAPIFVLGLHHREANADLRELLARRKAHPERDFALVVARETQRVAPPHARLMVWGWMPSLYLQTGMPCVTRHTSGHFLITPGPQRDALRAQFLAELQEARPEVFVDAVCSDTFTWFWPVERSGLESFPELAAHVRKNYRLARSLIGDATGVPLRIFVRQPEARPPASR